MISTILCLFSIWNSIYAWSHYVTISRSTIRSGLDVITFRPSGWLDKTKKALPFTKSPLNRSMGTSIKEIFYFPSVLSLNICDSIDSVVDDEHFCSLLTDKGFVVHILHQDNIRNDESIVYDTLAWRKSLGDLTHPIGIFTQDLSSPMILSYLSKIVALGNYGDIKLDQIGCVICLDSPPIHILRDSKLRKKALRRYSASYYSIRSFRRELQLDGISYQSLLNKWKSYTDSIERKKGLVKYFDHIQSDESVRSSTPLMFLSNDVLKDENTVVKEIELLEETISPTDEIVNVDKTSYLLLLSKSKKLWNQKTTGSGKKSLVVSDSKRHETNQVPIIDDKILLGPIPTNGYEVGQAMPHRILFLSSHRKQMKTHDSFITGAVTTLTTAATTTTTSDGVDNRITTMVDDFEFDYMDALSKEDKWSFESSQELSQLYRAGEAISVHPFDDDDDNDSNDLHISNYYNDNNNNNSNNNNNNNDSDDDGFITSSTTTIGHEEYWTQADMKRHHRIASVVSDWIRMLGYCGYLNGKSSNDIT